RRSTSSSSGRPSGHSPRRPSASACAAAPAPAGASARGWWRAPSRRGARGGRGGGLAVAGHGGKKRMQSWLAVPIVRRGVGIGLVEIDATTLNAFNQADVELLETVVRVLSGPVELAAHYAAEVRASELRDAFIGVISHELRTPITTIYGLSKMLRQRGATLDGTVVSKAIEDIEGEADRLQRLVEDLLVLSRAERGMVLVDGEPIVVG